MLSKTNRISGIDTNCTGRRHSTTSTCPNQRIFTIHTINVSLLSTLSTYLYYPHNQRMFTIHTSIQILVWIVKDMLIETSACAVISGENHGGIEIKQFTRGGVPTQREASICCAGSIVYITRH